MGLALGRSPHLTPFKHLPVPRPNLFCDCRILLQSQSMVSGRMGNALTDLFFLWRLLKQASLFLRSPFSLSPPCSIRVSHQYLYEIYIFSYIGLFCNYVTEQFLSMLKTAPVNTDAVRINKLILRLWMLQGRKRSCKCVLQTKLRSGVKCFPLPTANSHSPTSPHCQSSFLRPVTGELERFPGRYMPTNHYLC